MTSPEPQLLYRLAADFVVLVHGAYVSFVILGLLLVLAGSLCGWRWVRNPWFRLVHLAMILVVVMEAWLGVTCPLTVWEQSFRHRAGQATYQGDFIPSLVHELLFYELAPWVFTLAYTLFGAVVVATFWFAPPRFPRRNSATE